MMALNTETVRFTYMVEQLQQGIPALQYTYNSLHAVRYVPTVGMQLHEFTMNGIGAEWVKNRKLSNQ